MGRSSGDTRAAAVAAALSPYPWRGLTPRMLVRYVVGALDRQIVIDFLDGVPGSAIGARGPLKPADAGDERLHVLVEALESRHWRTVSLRALCCHLMHVLDAWNSERVKLHAELRRLLDEH